MGRRGREKYKANVVECQHLENPSEGFVGNFFFFFFTVFVIFSMRVKFFLKKYLEHPSMPAHAFTSFDVYLCPFYL